MNSIHCSREFLDQAWMKPEKKEKSPNICLITERFNDVRNWLIKIPLKASQLRCADWLFPRSLLLLASQRALKESVTVFCIFISLIILQLYREMVGRRRHLPMPSQLQWCSTGPYSIIIVNKNWGWMFLMHNCFCNTEINIWRCLTMRYEDCVLVVGNTKFASLSRI